ncbi:MAG TPA: DEAD/DEAH box helicase [Bacteroidales bacterium]|nr:DEAD/DEAH box helicase [Bacteroidales bacterium]
MTFEQTGLQENIVRATDELGFQQPTPIQERIIPLIINQTNDLIALAQTGTGKTAAFGLPLLQLTDMDAREIQSIVLCPTRELCMQITGDLKKYSKYIPGFKTVAVYGGADIRAQIKALKNGCQIVVGTPGRVMDLINREVLKLSLIRFLVLDEADEMLNMGFKEDLDIILAGTPQSKRTFLFSATMPDEIASIARNYMNEPEKVSVGKLNQGADNVRHEFYMVQAKDRYAALKRIADIYPNIYGIVFCRTRQITKEVADKLMADGYNADALHGDLSQAQRDFVMNRFRLKQLQLLVATDVAARGLDVNDLTHIINYDLPDDNEVYIHRTGRTARAGKSGVAISIIHSRETRKMKDIEKLLHKKFEQKPVPTGEEICEKQLFNLIDRIENVEVNETQIEPFMPVIYKKLDWLSREDLIKRFVSEEFNRFLAYYKNTKDLNIAAEGEERRRAPREQFITFKINAGFQDGLTPPRLIGLINELTRTRDIEIGKIEIGHKNSLFEVDKNFRDILLKSFQNAFFEGVEVKVRISDNRPFDKSHSKQSDKAPYEKSRPRLSDKAPYEKSRPRSSEKAQYDKSRPRSSDKAPYKKAKEKTTYDKPKAWADMLSDDWSTGRSGKKKNETANEKPKFKKGSRQNDSGGKKPKRSPFKKW